MNEHDLDDEREELRDRIRATGYRIARIAERCEVTERTVFAWLACEHTPRRPTRRRLERLLEQAGV